MILSETWPIGQQHSYIETPIRLRTLHFTHRKWDKCNDSTRNVNFFSVTRVWIWSLKLLVQKIYMGFFCPILEKLTDLGLCFFVNRQITRNNMVLQVKAYQWLRHWIHRDILMALCLIKLMERTTNSIKQRPHLLCSSLMRTIMLRWPWEYCSITSRTS